MLLSLGPEAEEDEEPEPAPTADAVWLSLGPGVGRVPTAAATWVSEGPLSLRAAGCALAPVAEVLSDELPSLRAMTSTTAAAAASVSSAASQSDRLDMCSAGSDRWGCAGWDMGCLLRE
jgi:pyrroline-5-carboxylate reductase